MPGLSVYLSLEDGRKHLGTSFVRHFKEKFCSCLPPTPLPVTKTPRKRVLSQFLSDSTALGFGRDASDIQEKLARRLDTVSLKEIRVRGLNCGRCMAVILHRSHSSSLGQGSVR